MLSSWSLRAKELVQKGNLSLRCLAVLMNVYLFACLCRCENSGSVLNCDSLQLKRRHKSSCTGMLTEEMKSKDLNGPQYAHKQQLQSMKSISFSLKQKYFFLYNLTYSCLDTHLLLDNTKQRLVLVKVSRE